MHHCGAASSIEGSGVYPTMPRRINVPMLYAAMLNAAIVAGPSNSEPAAI
jgi:hypothetical protein